VNRDLKMKILGAITDLAVGAGGRNQFARMLGMPKSTLSMILSGERDPPDDIEKRIYVALRAERIRVRERGLLITAVMNRFRTNEEIE
jgi:transcriptional regulator with XRE-family HTH domain